MLNERSAFDFLSKQIKLCLSQPGQAENHRWLNTFGQHVAGDRQLALNFAFLAAFLAACLEDFRFELRVGHGKGLFAAFFAAFLQDFGFDLFVSNGKGHDYILKIAI